MEKLELTIALYSGVEGGGGLFLLFFVFSVKRALFKSDSLQIHVVKNGVNCERFNECPL